MIVSEKHNIDLIDSDDEENSYVRYTFAENIDLSD
jgi:hypothetical protein